MAKRRFTSKSKKGNAKKAVYFPSTKKKSGITKNVNRMVSYKTKDGVRHMVTSVKQKVYKSRQAANKAMNRKN